MRLIENPPNPFHSTALEWEGPPPPAALELFEERAKSILTRNQSPDLGFEYSVNPYRGCFHACAYCYARPTHHYLDLGAGTDFDRRIVVKINAPTLLQVALRKPSWEGAPIVFSGNTDCYQPIEANYELTRKCLEICVRHQNPAYVITKSTLVRRDADILARLRDVADARVAISIPFASDADAKAIEPFAPPPSKRFETLRQLTATGVPTTVSLAPLIPGLNDAQTVEILERAREAGATRAFMTLVRLADVVRPIFASRLREAYPRRADKVLSQLDAMREGQRADFHTRMRGRGAHYAMLEQVFEKTKRRLGYEESPRELVTTLRHPRASPGPSMTKRVPKRAARALQLVYSALIFT